MQWLLQNKLSPEPKSFTRVLVNVWLMFSFWQPLQIPLRTSSVVLGRSSADQPQWLYVGLCLEAVDVGQDFLVVQQLVAEPAGLLTKRGGMRYGWTADWVLERLELSHQVMFSVPSRHEGYIDYSLYMQLTLRSVLTCYHTPCDVVYTHIHTTKALCTFSNKI